jgi:mRNA interferase RelE/StbE
MSFEIEFDPQAIDDLKRRRAFERAAILDVIERVLGNSPTSVGQSRIKRLRGIDTPQYRLRIGEIRVFYDVDGTNVTIMRVLAKADVDKYLKEMGYEA